MLIVYGQTELHFVEAVSCITLFSVPFSCLVRGLLGVILHYPHVV